MSDDQKWHCPACKHEVVEDSHRCPHCTTWLEFFEQEEDVPEFLRIIYGAVVGGIAFWASKHMFDQTHRMAVMIGIGLAILVYLGSATTTTKYVSARLE